MAWPRRKRGPDLNWLEVWILLILAAGGGWVGVDKIMAIAFLLERAYGSSLIRACFVPGPWSEDVIAALKRLTSLGLAEEMGGAYRLSEKGKMVIESYPMNDVKIRYPYVEIKFFVKWDVGSLKEYIRVNYPGWA
jgi:hypothetical protein